MLTTKRKRVYFFIATTFVYLVLAVLILPPVWQNPDGALITNGKFKDIYQVYWNAWHFAEQLKNGFNPWVTHYQLYPGGTSIILHSYTPFFGLIHCFVPSPSLSIYLGILIQMMLGAIGALHLSLLYLKNRWSQFLAGLFFAFNFYILQKLGVHYNLILIGLVPWTLIYFIKLSKDYQENKGINKRYLRLFVLFFFLQLFMDFYALFYVSAFVVAYTLFPFVQNIWRKSPVKFAVFLLSIFIASHFIARGLRISGIKENGALWASNQWASLIIPDTKYTHSEHFLFPGFIFWQMVIGALVFFRKSIKGPALMWLFFAGIFLMVGFPVFRWNEKEVWYLPNALIHFIPFVNNFREPSRFMEIWIWCGGMASLLIFEQHYSNNVKLLRGLLFIVGSAWMIEAFLYSKRILTTTSSKEFVFTLEEPEGKIQKIGPSIESVGRKEEAYLTIPFGIKDGFDEWGFFDDRWYLVQAATQYKIPSGYFSRIPKMKKEQAKKDAILQQIVLAQEGKPFQLIDSIQWEKYLKNNHYKGLLVDKAYLDQHEELALLLSYPLKKRKATFIQYNQP